MDGGESLARLTRQVGQSLNVKDRAWQSVNTLGQISSKSEYLEHSLAKSEYFLHSLAISQLKCKYFGQSLENWN